MNKIVCTVLAAAVTAFLTVGCGEKEKSSDSSGSSAVNMLGGFNAGGNVNIDAEDMPYGSNMCELSHDFDEKITYKTCYDSRYFVNANADNQDFSEIYRIHDFIASLNTKDAELLESLYYPGYLDYICEKNGISSIDEYFNNLYSAVESSLGKNFKINYICASNCLNESDETAAAYFNDTEEKLALTDSSAADKITSRKLVEIGGDTCFSNDEGTFLLTEYMKPFIVAVYEIDGEIYLF